MVLVPRRLPFRLLSLVDCKPEVEYIWKQAIKPHCSPFFTRFSNNSWDSWMNNIHDDYTIASGWKILNYISCGPCVCRKKTSQEFLTLLHCWKFALRSVWAKINHLCKHSPKQKLCLQFSSGSMLFMCMLHILFTFTVFFYFSFHSTAHKTLISKTICCMLYGVSWLSLQYRFISLQLFYKQEKDAQAHSHDSSSLHSLHLRVFFYFLTLHHLWRFCIHVAMKPCFVFGMPFICFLDESFLWMCFKWIKSKQQNDIFLSIYSRDPIYTEPLDN